MNGGRFLVSLKEVMRYESIIQVKTILQNCLEPVEYSTSNSSEYSKLIEEFIAEFVQSEDFDNLILSDNCQEVVVYISGYITHSLVSTLICNFCLECLHNHLETSPYVDSLNRGGAYLAATIPKHLCPESFLCY